MSFPVSARFLNLHADYTKVIGTDQLGVALDAAGDLEAGAGAGLRLKATLASQYTFSAVPRATSNPVLANDLCRKSYVDALFAGIKWKDAVVARTTANITLSGLQTLDGIALQAGDRALVMNQTTASQNGLYLVAAGSWTRTDDYLAGVEASGATVHVRSGTLYGNRTYNQTAEGAVGTASLVWAEVNSGVLPVAGDGILVTGNVWSVRPANESLVVSAAGVAVQLASNAGLETTVSGLRFNANLLTTETVADNADFLPVYDTSAGAMRKMSRANLFAGLPSGSTRFPEYTLTSTDVTNRTATLTGVAGNVGAQHLVFVNGLLANANAATLNTATGVLSWTGLTLDGRVAAGDRVQVWGHN